MVESQMTYGATDSRAKVKHQGILTMIVTDLKPFNIVSDPGFLNYSKLLDPRFTVGTAMYYRRLLDKAYIKGIEKLQQLNQLLCQSNLMGDLSTIMVIWVIGSHG